MWELFSVLKVPVQSLVAFNAGKLHQGWVSMISIFCILSSWQQGQILRANQCFPCMQVLLLRNESLFILFVKLLNLMWGVWSLFLVPGSFLTLVMLQYCCLLSESRVGPRYLMSYPSNFFHRWDNFLFSIWSFFSSSQLQTLSASLCYSIQHRWRLNSKSF